MSSSLEDKLLDLVLGEKASEIEPLDTRHQRIKSAQEKAEAIKQIFADEGYRSQPEHEKDVRRKLEILKGDSMTGQEWYKKFEYEMGNAVAFKNLPVASLGRTDALNIALDAAQRASNIEGNK